MTTGRRGYKVVRWWEGKLHSFTRNATHVHSVQYKLHEWAERPFRQGPLSLFFDLEDAIEFLKSEKLLHPTMHLKLDVGIFEAHYIPSKDKYLWTGGSWWGGARFCRMNLPKGTVLADKIKLERLVFPLT